MTNYYEKGSSYMSPSDRQDSITLAQAFNLVHAEWLAASKLVDENTQDKFMLRVGYIYALITQTRKKMLSSSAEQQKGLNI